MQGYLCMYAGSLELDRSIDIEPGSGPMGLPVTWGPFRQWTNGPDSAFNYGYKMQS